MEKTDKKPSRNYRLALIDAVSHERLWSVRFTKPIFIGALSSGIVVTLVAFYCLIAYTPIRTFIPGYPGAQSRREAVQNARKIDSLEMRLLQWELYSENLRRIVAGETPIRLDSVMLGREGKRSVTDAQYYAIRDSLLRADVQNQEQFQVEDAPKGNLPIPSRPCPSSRPSRAWCQRVSTAPCIRMWTLRPRRAAPFPPSWTERWCSLPGMRKTHT